MSNVSIIMPVYNKAEYLQETFGALLAQSWQDWELIVVDDGSTDESARRINEFAQKDGRICVVSQKNRGVSAARNRGLSMATGEWIWFIDADDLPDRNFLKNVFWKEYEDTVDVIAGMYQRLEKNGETTSVVLAEHGKIPPETLPDLFMKYQYGTGYWGYLWNKLIRRTFLEKTKVSFLKGLSLAEDLKFMTALYREGAGVFLVPYLAMRYTVDATHASKEKKIDYLAQLAIQMEIKDWIVERCGKKEYAKQFQWRISRYAAFVIFYGYEEQEDFIGHAKMLAENPKINPQLCTDQIDLTMRPIVWCLKGRRYRLLKAYLSLREEMKKMAGKQKNDRE